MRRRRRRRAVEEVLVMEGREKIRWK